MLTKVSLVRDIVFPGVMYEWESWSQENWALMMLLNCGAEEDSWEPFGLQEEQISQS